MFSQFIFVYYNDVVCQTRISRSRKNKNEQYNELDQKISSKLQQTNLFILQYNCKNFKNFVITTFLKNSKILKYNVIAIQKSWYNIYQFTIHNSISQTYNFYYANHANCENRKSKVCFFISKRIDIVKIVYKIHSRDVISIKITLNNFDSNLQYTMKIYNVYNESNI